MNLKLSTSAALAINAITKSPGDAAADDSKAILTDKVASSYKQHAAAAIRSRSTGGGKRIFQQIRNLQARSTVDLADQSSAATKDAKMGGIADANTIDRDRLPDIGILSRHTRASGHDTTVEGSSPLKKHKKHVAGNLMANIVKKSTGLDLGILGSISKDKREQRSTMSDVQDVGLHTRRAEQTYNYNYTTPYYYDVTWNDDMSWSDPYLCGYSGIGGTSPRRRSVAHGGIRIRHHSSGRKLDEDEESLINSSSNPLQNLPTCRCQEEQFTTCGPDLCNCLQDSVGNITSCIDEVNILCEGKNSKVEGGRKMEEWSESDYTMDQCVGNSVLLSSSYCTFLPCLIGGGSEVQCACDTFDDIVGSGDYSFYSILFSQISDCCQNQTDDAGRLTCFDTGSSYDSYYFPDSNNTDTGYVAQTLFEQCVSSNTNSTPECACNIMAPNLCAAYGTIYPLYCDIQSCCQTQTDDSGRVGCFSNQWYDECIGMRYSVYQCLCEKSSIECYLSQDPQQCEVYDCCSSNYGNETGMKACLNIGQNSTLLTTGDSTVSTTSPTVANENNTDTQVKNNTDSNSTSTDLPTPVAANTTTETPTPLILDNSAGTPTPSAAGSIFTIKSLALSVVSSIVGWLFVSR